MSNQKPRTLKRREEDVCLAHSGNENRAKLMLALLLILITMMTGMGGSMMVKLSDVKTDLATLTAGQIAVSYRFEVASESRQEIKEHIGDLHRRLSVLERWESGHGDHILTNP